MFPTDTDQCETYGHDLLTGGAVTEQEHRALAPAGRAFLKGCPYTRAHEEPSEDYPLLYTTGRTVYQFHTRTKTGRARSLQQAAPDAWVELSPADAADHHIAEGDLVRVESPRGSIEVKARIGQVMPGAVFAPFHYGSWDLDLLNPADHRRQANELTMTVWDPVSKQPYFKTAACRISKVRDGDGPHHSRLRPRHWRRSRATHPRRTAHHHQKPGNSLLPQRPRPAHQPSSPDRHSVRTVLMPHLSTYVALAHRSEQTLADSLRAIGQGHAPQPDVLFTCETLAAMSDEHVRQLTPIAERYGEQADNDDIHEPEARAAGAGCAPRRWRRWPGATGRTPAGRWTAHSRSHRRCAQPAVGHPGRPRRCGRPPPVCRARRSQPHFSANSS